VASRRGCWQHGIAMHSSKDPCASSQHDASHDVSRGVGQHEDA
jgi:hypothetical protein